MEAAGGKTGRVHLLDEVRGLDILMMILYHGLYDLVYLFGVSIPAFHTSGMHGFQRCIAGVFIFIAGISCRLSRSNVRRGLMTFGFGVVISLGTYLFMPGQMIWFGILHFLGTAMVLFGLLQKALDRIPPWLGAVLSLALYLLTLNVPAGRFGFPFLPQIPIPPVDTMLLLPLGFGGAGSDYFPLLPYFFFFLIGAYSGVYVRQGKMPGFFYRSYLPVLGRLGRKSLLIYMLHQPILYGVLWLFFRITR